MAWADIHVGKLCRPPADPVEIIARAIDSAVAIAQRPMAGSGPIVTIKQVAIATGLSYNTVHQRLSRLARYGVVDRVAKGLYTCGTQRQAEWYLWGTHMAQVFGMDLTRAAAG